MTEEDRPHSPDQRSALAAEIRSLPPRVRRVFRIPEAAPDFLEVVVAALHDVLATDDPRDWSERLDALPSRFERLFPADDLEVKVQRFAEWFESMDQAAFTADVENYLRRFKNGNAQQFLNRLLGSKRVLRMQRAFEEDWALCLLAIRRTLRATLRLAQALEDAVLTVSEEQRASYVSSSGSGSDFLRFMLKVDELIEAFLESERWTSLDLASPSVTVKAQPLTLIYPS